MLAEFDNASHREWNFFFSSLTVSFLFFFSFFFDDRLFKIMPVAWYIATKCLMYSTWFIYLHQYILFCINCEGWSKTDTCDEKHVN